MSTIAAQVGARLRVVSVPELRWTRCVLCGVLMEVTPGWYAGGRVFDSHPLSLACEGCATEHWPALLAELHAARYDR